MKKIKQRRQGAALVSLMVIVLLVSIAGAAMVGFAKQQAFSITRVRDYMKAQAYAEAGANEAYSILKSDFASAQDPSLFPARNFGDGGYDATVTAVGSDQASIESVGQCGNASITVKCDVMNMAPAGGGGGGGGGGSTPPAVGAYTLVIVSGEKMTWTGSGTMDINGGTIHSGADTKLTGSGKFNGNFESQGRIWSTGSVKINGDATAPSWKGKSPGNVLGTATTATPDPVALPPIDLTPYYDEALANGQVYNGYTHWSGSSKVTIPGGIMWVNGKFKYSGSGGIEGCIIATGDIDITGSGDQIKVGDFPALISRDGDIDIAGSGKFHGLIYAINGDFDKSGSGDTWGSIFCKGKFKKSGSWQLCTYENSTPVPPGGGGGGGGGGSSDHVVITAWQQ